MADATPATMPTATASGADPCWTAAQRAAIEHVAGDLLVSAGAGSGKTAVLAERCARLVTHPDPALRTDVDRLLVMTFTDAAANEMRTRIARAIRDKLPTLAGTPEAERSLAHQLALVERASIGTIDAFCARLLRTYFHEADVDPAFEIIDVLEAQLLRAEVLDDVLATWHALPAEDPRAQRFGDLWEAYETAGEAALRAAIDRMDGLLSTLADPTGWVARVRHDYTAAGAAAMVDALAADVARELELRAAAAVRHADAAQPDEPALTKMAGVLRAAGDVLRGAAAILRNPPADTDPWTAARAASEQIDWSRITLKGDVAKCFKADVFDPYKKYIREKLLPAAFPAGLTRQRMIDDLVAQQPLTETLLALAADFQRAYAAAKRETNRLDFNDVKRRAYNLLTAPGSAASADMRARYAHVLVDEVQDINPLDAAIIQCVRNPAAFGGRGNLFLVGDIKQSIYGFRLADPSIFLAAQDRLRGQSAYFAVVDLQHNFRSLPDLLEALNGMFTGLLGLPVSGIDYAAHHTLLPPETPPAGAPHDGAAPPFPGAPIELLLTRPRKAGAGHDSAAPAENADAADETSVDQDAGDGSETAPSDAEREAGAVARRIGQLIAAGTPVRGRDGRMRPLAYRDIVILLRGAKAAAPRFARALALAGIPVHAELSAGFFDAPEVQELIALLQLLDNPLQDIPSAAVLLSAFGGFSHDDLAVIRLAYPDRAAAPFAEAVRRYAAEHPAGPDDGATAPDPSLAQRLNAFHARLEHYRQLTRTLPLHEAIAEIFRDSGILITLAAQPGGTQRVANVQMLHQHALEFATFRRQGLFRFLEFLGRLKEGEADLGEAPTLSDASDVVRIMTIHKSKGLEFPVVIVAALGAPLQSDSARIRVDRQLGLALQVVDPLRHIYFPSAAVRRKMLASHRERAAEELRLLYVALTRAREHLILSGVAGKAADRRSTHAGRTLPEDQLLDANQLLDWCLAVAHSQPGLFAIRETNDLPSERPAAPPLAEPLADLPPADPTVTAAVAPQLARLIPHEHVGDLSQMPALVSVTQLKRRLAAALPEEFSPTALDGSDGAGAAPGAARAPLAPPALEPPAWLRGTTPRGAARGSATHLLLQHLNLATLHAPADVATQLDTLVADGTLSAAEAGLITLPDLAWFLFDAPLGGRIRARAAAGDASRRATPDANDAGLLRELGFSWMLPPQPRPTASPPHPQQPTDPRDLQQLRGIIDLLLLSPDAVEIVDYKTDSSHHLTDQTRAGYRIQMNLYARAAANILGRPINAAHLVYLTARTIETIADPARRSIRAENAAPPTT